MATQARLRAREIQAQEAQADRLAELETVVNRLDRKLNKVLKQLDALSGAAGAGDEEDEEGD